MLFAPCAIATTPSEWFQKKRGNSATAQVRSSAGRADNELESDIDNCGRAARKQEAGAGLANGDSRCADCGERLRRQARDFEPIISKKGQSGRDADAVL